MHKKEKGRQKHDCDILEKSFEFWTDIILKIIQKLAILVLALILWYFGERPKNSRFGFFSTVCKLNSPNAISVLI